MSKSPYRTYTDGIENMPSPINSLQYTTQQTFIQLLSVKKS